MLEHGLDEQQYRPCFAVCRECVTIQPLDWPELPIPTRTTHPRATRQDEASLTQSKERSPLFHLPPPCFALRSSSPPNVDIAPSTRAGSLASRSTCKSKRRGRRISLSPLSRDAHPWRYCSGGGSRVPKTHPTVARTIVFSLIGQRTKQEHESRLHISNYPLPSTLLVIDTAPNGGRNP